MNSIKYTTRDITTSLRLHLGSLDQSGRRPVMTERPNSEHVGELMISAGPATVSELEPIQELVWNGVVETIVVRDAAGNTYRLLDLSARWPKILAAS